MSAALVMRGTSSACLQRAGCFCFPNLGTLELWLGTPCYGCCVSTRDLNRLLMIGEPETAPGPSCKG